MVDFFGHIEIDLSFFIFLGQFHISSYPKRVKVKFAMNSLLVCEEVVLFSLVEGKLSLRSLV